MLDKNINLCEAKEQTPTLTTSPKKSKFHI